MSKRYSLLSAALPIAITLFSSGFARAQNNQIIEDAHNVRAYLPARQASVAAGNPRLIGITNYFPDAANLSAVDSTSIVYTNASDAEISEMYVYKRQTTTWTADWKYTYTYVNGNNTKTELARWNQTKNLYVPVGRYSYTYSAAGFRTSLFYEIWNAVTGSYSNGIQESYMLDGLGNVTDMLQQMWNASTSSWVNNQHLINTYNSAGKLTEQIVEQWNSTNSLWQRKSRVTNTYNAAGLYLTNEVTDSWDAANSSWMGRKRISYTLNAAGLPTTATTEIYNLVYTMWDLTEQATYTYNALGAPATILTRTWDAIAQAYNNKTSATYTYNSYNQLKRLKTLTWVSNNWAVGDGSGQTINYYEKESNNPNQVANIIQADWCLSPNPANGSIRISLSGPKSQKLLHATIMDFAGRTVRSEDIDMTSGMLSTVSLPNGSYLLHLSGGDLKAEVLKFSVIH